jgi:uncharacterized protein YbaR (Trm112 family)
MPGTSMATMRRQKLEERYNKNPKVHCPDCHMKGRKMHIQKAYNGNEHKVTTWKAILGVLYCEKCEMIFSVEDEVGDGE